jgi:hypothetical protein
MKKTAIICAVLMFAAVFGASAQTGSSEKSDVFYKLVHIQKIYTHELGYKVVFLKSNYEMGSVYIPARWFGKADGKGILVYETPGQPSYFSIFWLNGKFDHIVLHIPNSVSNSIWGILDSSVDFTSQFSVEEPKLNF